MAHSTVKVYLHFVWTTKNRERSLVNKARQRVKDHIIEYAAKNEIGVEAIDVQPEHVHLLVSLLRSQKIEDIAKFIKGESSHWINANNLISDKFAWQTGYWAGSVSYQHMDAVKKYIERQDEHHKRKSFVEEFEEVLRDYGYSAAEIAEVLRLESH